MEERQQGHAERLVAELPDVGLREAINAASRTFNDALKRSSVYMGTGIFIAMIFMAVNALVDSFAHTIPRDSVLSGAVRSSLITLAKLLDHLSVGFFVSSIAVFFYEWGSHAKHALDLSLQLGQLLRAEGEDTIRLGMQAAFAGRGALQAQHEKFIAAMRYLDNENSRARDADMAFLTLFVEHAARYGDQLKTLREHLARPGNEVGRPFHLDFTKLDYADKILTQWMGLLGEGDSYVTMSNPRTWSALKGGAFKKAGREAVYKGTSMRRVFIMDHPGDKHSQEDMRNLIGHYQFAAGRNEQGRGLYRIQIANMEVFEPRGIKGENQHYGIFTARFGPSRDVKDRDKRTSVAFKVKGAEVENFELVAVEEGGELERNFEEIWESLESSPEGPVIALDRKPTDGGAARFLDAVLKREMSALPKHYGLRMEIISTRASWKHYDLPKFSKATADFEVCHLFVLERGDTDSQIAELTKSQRESRANRKAKWNVGLYTEKADDRRRHWLKPRWQFLDVAGKPLHHSVFNLHCANDLSDFFLTPDDSPTKAADYAKSFTELWERAEPLKVQP